MESKIARLKDLLQQSFKEFGVNLVPEIKDDDTIYKDEKIWIDISNGGKVWFTISKRIDDKDYTVLNFEYDLDYQEVAQIAKEVKEYLSLLRQGLLYIYVKPYRSLGIFKGIHAGGVVKRDGEYIAVPGSIWETLGLKELSTAKGAQGALTKV
jgi:hypothetical protein